MAERLIADKPVGGKKNFIERRVPALPKDCVPRGSPARAAARGSFDHDTAAPAELHADRSPRAVPLLRQSKRKASLVTQQDQRPQDGRSPRPMKLNATRLPRPKSQQRRRRKPWAKMPSSRKASSPSLTNCGRNAPVSASACARKVPTCCCTGIHPAPTQSRLGIDRNGAARQSHRGATSKLPTVTSCAGPDRRSTMLRSACSGMPKPVLSCSIKVVAGATICWRWPKNFARTV